MDDGACPPGQVCDQLTLTCTTCDGVSALCPEGQQCFGGVCGRCDPTANACGPGLICADDRATGQGYRCRPCNPQAETDECSEGFCIGASEMSGEGRCEICSPSRPVGSNGCVDSSPICELNPVSNSVECVQCNDSTRPCPSGSTCDNGRCEGCRPPTNDAPSTCPEETPICTLDSSGEYQCTACNTDAQCVVEFRDDSQRDVCVNGRCIDCDSTRPSVENRGCDLSGNKPICNGQSCDGCSGDIDCSRLQPNNGRNYCVEIVAIAGTCEVCKPGTIQGCGRRTCEQNLTTMEFECAPCDTNGDCGAALYGSQYYCVNGDCEICDSNAAVGNNGCSENEPTCAGDPLSCRPCQGGGSCGSDYCVGGQCKPCTTQSDQRSRLGTYSYSAHNGCTPGEEAICKGDRCEYCERTSECPTGECTRPSGFNYNVCRESTATLCRSRHLIFDDESARCISCSVDPDACPLDLQPCRPTPQRDETDAIISKCNGCTTHEDCLLGSRGTICNVVEDGEK